MDPSGRLVCAQRDRGALGHKKELASDGTSALGYLLEGKILLLAVAVAVEELINTTCGINELVLASVEWVAGRGDFKLYEWVLNAVDLDGLLGVDGRA